MSEGLPPDFEGDEPEDIYAAWEEYESGLLPDPPPATTLNHGGPGVCSICYPNGAPAKKAPTQQEELQL